MKKSHPFILALLMVIAIASISEAQQKKGFMEKSKGAGIYEERKRICT